MCGLSLITQDMGVYSLIGRQGIGEELFYIAHTIRRIYHIQDADEHGRGVVKLRW